MSDTLLAYHFSDGTFARGRLRGKPIEIGHTYAIKSTPQLCTRGFHGSVRVLDALGYAPYNATKLSRVELGGVVVADTDKHVAQQRTHLWIVDVERALHEFSADAAGWILDKLEATGRYTVDPRSRAAVEAKRAWLRGEIDDKRLAAAGDAAGAAAGAAARPAAGDAARAAARPAAWAAARPAAWAAAWAARDAAWAAAWAAWDAARAAAWDANATAYAASRAELNTMLLARLSPLFPEGAS